ncbi:MAG: NADH-quinone oxidoreductase subunit D [Deltaproteobacteria bacterium]|nr:MAG: NADH-quinone oxidoreductase subunit D [Deltaproteobacteria bacterium]
MLEEIRDEGAATGERYVLNMGPQHPSMHGVLRLRLELIGEEIQEAEAVIGYAHRAHEKMAENRTWPMFLPNTSRVDYLSGMIYNLAYCQAVEKMLEIEVPERAEYIRIIAGELNRISSHLLWLGTYVMDIGGLTPFLYAWDDREQVLNILERITGSRLTYSYGRFGGLTMDVDDVFIKQTQVFLERMKGRLVEYDKLVRQNVIFIKRSEGVGIIDAETCRRYGVTGPNLRAAGVAYDVRKDEPYGIYDRFDFEVPTLTTADSLARYDIRIREIEESLKIVGQALRDLPEGPIMPDKPKKKFKPAAGETYFAVEAARGHFGMYLVSDGSETPFKIKLRTPSFSNLAAMPEVLRKTMVADIIAIVGSIDIVLPEIDR